jgi:hypothetical protein
MRSILAVIALCVASACALDSGDGTHPPPDAGGNACTKTSDCTVVPLSCCGSCGAATVGDAVAIPHSRAAEHQQLACGGVMGCPPCFGEDDPNLTATCVAGQCQLVDVRDEPTITACAAPSDCKVRLAGCCACREVVFDRVLAIRNDAEGAYQDLTCDPGFACPECDPALEPAFPDCQSGRCSVAILTDNLR